MMRTIRNKGIASIATIATLLAATHAVAATMYVTYPGNFAPDGRSQYPFSHLRGAMCQSPSGGTIEIAGGSYHEYGDFTQPVTITAPAGETVEIGRYGENFAELRLIGYNTHLDLDANKCKDETRANWIGWNLKNAGYDADVVGLSEVWSGARRDDLFDSSSYTDEYYGDDLNGRVKNSGLLFMTRNTSMRDEEQVSYERGDGWDWFANKGFIRATFTHEEFVITVFCTHTQSGEGENEKETRGRQLEQLAKAIRDWRASHPTHVVFALGDFNVEGEESEYFGKMDDTLGSIAHTLDTARNEGCGSWTHCTACADNHLKQRWGDDGKNTRLDYILYAPSYDGSVQVVATDYQWLRFTIPSWGDTIPCGKDNAQTRHLSDHDGVYGKFELTRVK